MNWQAISKQIETATGQPFQVKTATSLAGGDINTAYRLEDNNQFYFVKLNRADLLPMFEAELAGLQEMANTNTVSVPRPITCGKTQTHSFLVLENIELKTGNTTTDSILGQQLAQLHLIQQPFFGWHRDNTIGSTPQINTKSVDWLFFWREHRLGFQLRLAAQKGHKGQLQVAGNQLLGTLDSFFTDYHPKPSLLHGDLWGGNASANKQGKPVLFDPACYYGDREADIAMTELFGGFSRDFYAAYQNTYPLDANYNIRINLYNLYHILNHLNLFGGGYLRQAEHIINQLLAQIER